MHSWGPSGHPGTEPTPTRLAVESLHKPCSQRHRLAIVSAPHGSAASHVG
jgi:hypothetical protein